MTFGNKEKEGTILKVFLVEFDPIILIYKFH